MTNHGDESVVGYWTLHCNCIFSFDFCSITICVVLYYHMWWIKIFISKLPGQHETLFVRRKVLQGSFHGCRKAVRTHGNGVHIVKVFKNTKNCTRLQDFAYTISKFFRGLYPRSSQALPVFALRHQHLLGSPAFPLFLFYEKTTAVLMPVHIRIYEYIREGDDRQLYSWLSLKLTVTLTVSENALTITLASMPKLIRIWTELLKTMQVDSVRLRNK